MDDRAKNLVKSPLNTKDFTPGFLHLISKALWIQRITVLPAGGEGGWPLQVSGLFLMEALTWLKRSRLKELQKAVVEFSAISQYFKDVLVLQVPLILYFLPTIPFLKAIAELKPQRGHRVLVHRARQFYLPPNGHCWGPCAGQEQKPSDNTLVSCSGCGC